MLRALRTRPKLVDDMVKTAEKNNLNVFVFHHKHSNINHLRYDIKREQITMWHAFKNLFNHGLMQTVIHFKHDYNNRLNNVFRADNSKDYIVVTDAQKLSYKDAQELDGFSTPRP